MNVQREFVVFASMLREIKIWNHLAACRSTIFQKTSTLSFAFKFENCLRWLVAIHNSTNEVRQEGNAEVRMREVLEALNTAAHVQQVAGVFANVKSVHSLLFERYLKTHWRIVISTVLSSKSVDMFESNDTPIDL